VDILALAINVVQTFGFVVAVKDRVMFKIIGSFSFCTDGIYTKASVFVIINIDLFVFSSLLYRAASHL